MSVRGKSGLPWAGDLPIAGHAFRNEPAHAEDRLVVLLEPTIIQSNETWNQDLRGVRLRLDGYEPKFISFADDINRHMPRYVVELVADALNGRERSVRGARVLVVGVAYKPNVADTRDSPAFEIVETLQRKGAAVAYHDPHVPTFTVGGATLQSVDLGQADLAAWDVILILTGHDGCDWKRMAR